MDAEGLSRRFKNQTSAFIISQSRGFRTISNLFDGLHQSGAERLCRRRGGAGLASVLLFQRYDHISLLASGINVTMGLGDLLEGIASIDNRSECSRLRQSGQKT